jgi:endonuclease YncB( thermonuclease family)
MSKKQLILSVVLVLAGLAIVTFLGGGVITGRVVSIQDGDTITVLEGKTQYRVRLNGIDCPEKGQAFGNAAKQFTSDMVFGRVVKVKYKDKDRYGRYLGTVTLGKRNLNQELVKAGLAWHYKAYSKDPVLAGLEVKARMDRAGLWADKHPEAPWEYRRQKREKP